MNRLSVTFPDADLSARVATLEAIHSAELARFRFRLVRDKTSGDKLQAIAESVARHAGITVDQMRTRGREQWRCAPRMIAMFLQRKQGTRSMEALADWWGMNDHSTVMHACKVVSQRMDLEPEFRKTVESLL